MLWATGNAVVAVVGALHGISPLCMGVAASAACGGISSPGVLVVSTGVLVVSGYAAAKLNVTRVSETHTHSSNLPYRMGFGAKTPTGTCKF